GARPGHARLEAVARVRVVARRVRDARVRALWSATLVEHAPVDRAGLVIGTDRRRDGDADARGAGETDALAARIAVGVARARDARRIRGDDPAHGRLMTARVAHRAGRPVRRAVVARLVALADAVATHLESAGRGAAIAGGEVAVVTVLVALADAVPARLDPARRGAAVARGR